MLWRSKKVKILRSHLPKKLLKNRLIKEATEKLKNNEWPGLAVVEAYATFENKKLNFEEAMQGIFCLSIIVK